MSKANVETSPVERLVMCGVCKHWDTEGYVARDCNPNNDGWGMCRKHSHERGEDVTNELADAICYGEGIEGELLTRRNFACVCGDT